MLNISVDIPALGSFLDLPIPFHRQWLMGVEEFSHQVGWSISSTFWKNTKQGNYIPPINNIIYCLYNIMWLYALYLLAD